MILSDQDRDILRAHWLGEPLPEDLRRLLAHLPRSKTRRERHLAARQYLDGLSQETERRTRRLVLAFSPAAIGLLGELIQGESKDLARRAAVDLMRMYRQACEDERTAQAAETGAAERRLAESLSDTQAEVVLGVLADVGAALLPHDPDGGLPNDQDNNDTDTDEADDHEHL